MMTKQTGAAHEHDHNCWPVATSLYGTYDIFGDATGIVRRRFPRAVQLTLEGCGHLQWIQNPIAYADALHQFYASARGSR